MRIVSPRIVGTAPVRSLPIAVAIALVILGAGFAGFHQVTTTQTAYDDEGYVMLSLRSFMDGAPLYDETYTQYGPVPFVVGSAFFRATGLAVTHDATRMRTLGVWLGASALGACLVVRLTGAWWMLPLGFLAIFFHLERLCLEPGHPQELCVLGVLLAALLVAGREDPRSNARIAVLGTVIATVLLTKLNVGLLLLAGVQLALIIHGPRTRVARMMLAASVGAVVAMPFVLTRMHLRAPAGTLLPLVAAASTLSTVVVVMRERGPAGFGWLHLVTFGSSVAIVSAAWAVATLALGTSLSGLWYGLGGVHTDFVKHFSTAPPLAMGVGPWSVASLVLACVAHRALWTIHVGRAVLIGALVVASLSFWSETLQPMVSGMNDRGASGVVVGFAAPALWVLLRPPGRHATDTARLALAAMAGLQPLAAYPTPGSQMAVGSVLVMVGCLVALHDALGTIAESRISVPRLSIIALTTLLVATLIARDVHFRTRWRSLVPLRLPGAHLLRMERRGVARYRWLARTLRERTDTFVFGEHSLNSFYFWTGLPPPTALNATYWPFMLTSSQQARVVAALSASRRAAVVHVPYDGTLPDSTLRTYITRNFEPAVTDGYFHVWLRKHEEAR